MRKRAREPDIGVAWSGSAGVLVFETTLWRVRGHVALWCDEFVCSHVVCIQRVRILTSAHACQSVTGMEVGVKYYL